MRIWVLDVLKWVVVGSFFSFFFFIDLNSEKRLCFYLCFSFFTFGLMFD